MTNETPATPKPLDGEAVLRRLLTAANLLFAQMEGCVQDHHSVDFAEQGVPGWLADCKTDIERAADFLVRSTQKEATEEEIMHWHDEVEPGASIEAIKIALAKAGLRIVKDATG